MSDKNKIAEENYKESMHTPYALSRRYGSLTFEVAVQNVRDALNQMELKVVNHFNLHDHIQENLGKEINRYTILGACNAELALEAFSTANKAGIMLPCNVIVQEMDNEGIIEVSVADPTVTFSLAKNEKLTTMGTKAKERLHQILDHIEKSNVKL